MSLLELARRPPQWLRAVLAGLLLAFALNSIAHAAHAHEPDKATTAVHAACGYCTTFGTAGPTPAHAPSLPVPMFVAITIVDNDSLPVASTPLTSAQARAPPRFLKHI